MKYLSFIILIPILGILNGCQISKDDITDYNSKGETHKIIEFVIDFDSSIKENKDLINSDNKQYAIAEYAIDILVDSKKNGSDELKELEKLFYNSNTTLT